MIKIGIRHNLIYPAMLIVFIGLRKIVEILIDLKNEKATNIHKFLLPFLIFLSKFIGGLIASKLSKYIVKSNSGKTIVGFKLIHSKRDIPIADKNSKIFVLLFFASYFDIIGTVIRKYFSNAISNKKFLEEKLKCFQIITSALLCYFTIRIKIYKHNLFCLIIIFICLVIVIIFEMNDERLEDNITSIGVTIVSGLARAFLDTIEKYLFEFDNLNPFKVMMLEGFINTILIICLYFFDNSSIVSDLRKFQNLIYLIVLLILYFIFSALKNIYRVVTIKLYSPMTRALAESFLDPIIIIYSLISDLYSLKPNDKNWNFYFDYGINIFLSIIMAFCSCVYNDFIVLYCCGLEYNTYLEVSKRCCLMDEISPSLDEEEDNELKIISNDNNVSNTCN